MPTRRWITTSKFCPLLYAAVLDLTAHKGAFWSSVLQGSEKLVDLFSETHLCTEFISEKRAEFKISQG